MLLHLIYKMFMLIDVYGHISIHNVQMGEFHKSIKEIMGDYEQKRIMYQGRVYPAFVARDSDQLSPNGRIPDLRGSILILAGAL